MFLALLAAPLGAQDVDVGAAARRVLAGGDWCEMHWRRGDDGMLECESLAAGREFVPLLGEDFAAAFDNGGAIGWLSLWLHGNGDLLSMTDAGFHLRCLGIDTSDDALREYLRRPLPATDGAHGRAELFDRMLAIDLLRRRGCVAAETECKALARAASAPAMLRQRALSAIASLHGAPAPEPRRALDPTTLRLPAVFDACIVIDHDRLPDLGWLTAFGRRLHMRLVARAMLKNGGTVPPAVCNGGQRNADVVAELPFGLALRFGNVRLDQSCIFVTGRPDGDPPFSIQCAASGSVESERWQQAKMPPSLVRSHLAGARAEFSPESVQLCTDDDEGLPRPEVAKELLQATGAAIRVVIPPQSKLWRALAFLGLPPSRGAELRIAFAEPASVQLLVRARDQDTAAAWLAKATELLPQGTAAIERELREPLQHHPALRRLVDALAGVNPGIDGGELRAELKLAGWDRRQVQEVLEVLLR